MRKELKQALGTLALLALGACGSPQTAATYSMDPALRAKLDGAETYATPRAEACQALEDQSTTQRDVLIDLGGEAKFFAPFDDEAVYVFDDGHTSVAQNGPQAIYQRNPSAVLCTFELQNGRVRSVQQ